MVVMGITNDLLFRLALQDVIHSYKPDQRLMAWEIIVSSYYYYYYYYY